MATRPGRPPEPDDARPVRRGGRSDLGPRVLSAIPLIAFAVFIVTQGGLIFAVSAAGLAIVALAELYGMMSRVRPVNVAGFIGAAGMIFAALYGDQLQMLLALAATVPIMFLLALVRPWREHSSWAFAATMFGVAWIGLAFAHAVLLRELPHGGALLVDTLIGAFVGDTCAYFGGRWWGMRPLAPVISPNKTLEGFLSGIVGGTLAFWLFAVAYQDWFSGEDALLIGFAVAVAAPLGDLFESMIKRDLEVKDTGRIFGPHGGVLDRLDAVFFAVPTAYYMSKLLLF